MQIHNAGQQLRLAVLSTLGQTFRDWELLIIDGGSTDNAVKAITNIDDARIRIIRDGTNKD
jgi:glycosyltransferase involved in cell wall biosynthesis